MRDVNAVVVVVHDGVALFDHQSPTHAKAPLDNAQSREKADREYGVEGLLPSPHKMNP